MLPESGPFPIEEPVSGGTRLFRREMYYPISTAMELKSCLPSRVPCRRYTCQTV